MFSRNFLSNFGQTSWIRMLKTLNMALVRCPVRFFKEITTVSLMKKPQIATKKDKNPERAKSGLSNSPL